MKLTLIKKMKNITTSDDVNYIIFAKSKTSRTISFILFTKDS